MKHTNCINCGAPLKGSVCEYCGTEYGSNNSIVIPSPKDFEVDTQSGYATINFGGKEYKCYINDVAITESQIVTDLHRDFTGRLFKESLCCKKKFNISLVEV